MLTVKQINEVSFGKAGFSGYKPDDVDNFIDEVAASYQQLLAERDDAVKKVAGLTAQLAEMQAKQSEMQGKLAVLAEKVESYRTEEDGIKDAILSAQKISRDTIQESKDKAQIIMEDAQADARKLMDNAKIEASKAAKEYMAQAEQKREELEEMKRQVTAFRSSLLEMYKKHLECINHIPSFRGKEVPVAEAEEVSAREEVAEPVEKAPDPAPVRQEPKAVEVQQQPTPAPAPVAVKEPTLEDRIDYSESYPSSPEEEYLEETDLADMGINGSYVDIPETLKKEKKDHFSHLEFGDGVEIGKKKHRK